MQRNLPKTVRSIKSGKRCLDRKMLVAIRRVAMRMFQFLIPKVVGFVVGSITKIKEGLFGPGAAANRSLGDIYVRIDAAKTGASEEEVRGI